MWKCLLLSPYFKSVSNNVTHLQRRDMEAVKLERAKLMDQLRMVKTDPGKAGGELQEDDIQYLRGEVEIKKAKLNELHEVSVGILAVWKISRLEFWFTEIKSQLDESATIGTNLPKKAQQLFNGAISESLSNLLCHEPWNIPDWRNVVRSAAHTAHTFLLYTEKNVWLHSFVTVKRVNGLSDPASDIAYAKIRRPQVTYPSFAVFAGGLERWKGRAVFDTWEQRLCLLDTRWVTRGTSQTWRAQSGTWVIGKQNLQKLKPIIGFTLY